MKPRLREDVHFMPHSAGVFVLMAGRQNAGFSIVGRDCYACLKRLAPFLNGMHTVDELVASLNERRQIQVRRLVSLLHEASAVRDATGDLPHSLSESVRRAHAHVISFIGNAVGSPEHRFQRYRDSRPTVVGSGVLVTPLVHALLATGVARVRLMVTSERPTNLGRMMACLKHALGPEAEAAVEITTREDLLARAAEEGCRSVLHVSDAPVAGRSRMLARFCGRRSVIFGEATVQGERALIRVTAGSEPAGTREDVAVPEQAFNAYLTGPAAAIVSNHLCAAFLAQVAGIAASSSAATTEVNLETLVVAPRPRATSGALAGSAPAGVVP